MKPLSADRLDSFLERFNNFIDAELRSIEVISATTIAVTLAGQDSARAFDWVSIKLEFSDVSDAQLIEESRLSFVDMSDGISIINTDNKFAFGIGKCYNISGINSSTCRVVSSSLKYQEGLF